MTHILPLTAKEIEKRLLKTADLFVYQPIYNETQSCIDVTVKHAIENGSEIKFKAPVDCSKITKLCVKYSDDKEEIKINKTFAFADANGNNIGELSNLFAKGAIVKVILDLDSEITGVDGAAFVQNANTNAYLEKKFASITNGAAVQIITWEEYD